MLTNIYIYACVYVYVCMYIMVLMVMMNNLVASHFLFMEEAPWSQFFENFCIGAHNFVHYE